MTPRQASLEDVFVRLVAREEPASEDEAGTLARERARTAEMPPFTEGPE